MSRLRGRTALVTGGAKGIGKQFAMALAEAGAKVVIADIVDGDSTVAAIRKSFGRDACSSVVVDISDEASVTSMVAAAWDRLGQFDILVNNAALFATVQKQLFTQISLETWDRVMAVNLRGTFLVTKHIAPHMISRGYGKIINIGSGTATKGVPRFLHYVTSKGGVIAMTRAMARELGDYGIRVNTLSPGFTLSESVVGEYGEMARMESEINVQSRALKRDQSPQDLLGALIFLASAESDFITGQNIAVDGGSTNL